VSHVWADHEHACSFTRMLGSFDGHLDEFQDVWVIKLLEEFYFSQRSDRESILFVVH
jgi:hypothetical protein